jgi:hypothetical protein
MVEIALAAVVVMFALYGFCCFIVMVVGTWKEWREEERLDAPVKASYKGKLSPSHEEISNTLDKLEDKPIIAHSPVQRRMGVAEMRRRAEMESVKPLIKQAQVTEKNTRALEG